MSFPLIGNEKVKRTVLSFIASGSIPHAILVTGDAGTGKHTLAEYIAGAAVCTGNEKPCGNCHGCGMAKAHSHPDIIHIKREAGKKELGVSVIREVRSDAFIRPHEADRKVYIIEDADCMNQSSQNAILKVLEEPPESVIFILISKSKAFLLPTVISRCTALSLLAPAEDEGAQEVMRLASCDMETAAEAVKSTHGNIGRALTLIGDSKENTAALLAKEFTALVLSGNEYEMLRILSKLEKDRTLAEEFFSELRINIAEELRKLPKNGRRARLLFSLYSDTERYLEHLKSNVNLPLLFCGITADINEYRG